MAQGLFTLRQQVQGIVQKAWIAPAGTSAGVFNGTSQYLTVPYSSAFNFGTGDFTIEGWINLSSLSASYYVLAGTWTTGTSDEWLIQIQNNNTIRFLTTAGTSFYSATLTTGVWYHIAGVRSGSTITLYVNGASVGSYTNANSIGSVSKTVYIGAQQTPIWYMNGYISNFRIVKGTALYTSNFAIPSAPLGNITGTSLLTLQNATIIDNSSNASTITNVGSVTTSTISPTAISVNGLSTPAVDYLVVAGGGSGGGGNYGSGGGGGAGGLLQGSLNVTPGASYFVTIGGGGAASSSTSVGNLGNNSVIDATSFGAYTGRIVALGGGGGGYSPASQSTSGGSGGGGDGANDLSRRAGASAVFGQGNQGGNGPLPFSVVTTYTAGGGGGAGTKGLNGVTAAGAGNGGAGISSAISGTVTPYAGGGGGAAGSDYGVPTVPAGAGGVGGGAAGGQGAAGSSAPANFGGGGGGGGYTGMSYGSGAGGSGIVIVSYPDVYAGAASTTGSPTVSTSGSGSLLPGSTSSWIYYAAQSGFAFDTGNFTIEFWVNFTSTTSGASGTSYLVDFRGASNPSNSSLGIYQNSGGLQLFTQSGLNLNYGTPLINTWLNIAVSRVSGTLYWFVNGSLVSSGADTTNYTVGSTGPSFMGSSYYNNYGLQGYMSNIRVIKGTGLYTANYTVTTMPYTVVTNTQLLLNTVSGGYLADGSTNSYAASVAGTVAWNQLSPFATGLGYKNRVYTWNSSGSITF